MECRAISHLSHQVLSEVFRLRRPMVTVVTCMDQELANGVSGFKREIAPASPTGVAAQVAVDRAIHPAIVGTACAPSTGSPHCVICHDPHLAKIQAAIRAGEPIRFALPAFPGKSPNLSKVLGPLPDLAERLALRSLHKLCLRIKLIYPHGARILLCSDGRVFSDVVGMRESDVTRYQLEIDRIIRDEGLTHLSTLHLDHLAEDGNFDQARLELLKSHGASLESLRARVLRGSLAAANSEDRDAHRMFCGITRFLREDASYAGQTKSRTQLQREAKANAYEVIRRSNAWSGWIAQEFPEAIRLSIHPQPCGSPKIGVRLIGDESWMTPWHGVAVKVGAMFELMKKSEAEALGATLVTSNEFGLSHYEMPKSKSAVDCGKRERISRRVGLIHEHAFEQAGAY